MNKIFVDRSSYKKRFEEALEDYRRQALSDQGWK